MFVAATANAALEKATFDLAKLPPNPPLNSDCVEAGFMWLEFKPCDFRYLENDYGLPEGEAQWIVNALAPTPVYESGKPGATFLRVVSAADFPDEGEYNNVCTSLSRKCCDVLYMLNATGSWCQSCARGKGIAECRFCHAHYLLDRGLLLEKMPGHLRRGVENWQNWCYSDYVCWRCRKAGRSGTTEVTRLSDPTMSSTTKSA